MTRPTTREGGMLAKIVLKNAPSLRERAPARCTKAAPRAAKIFFDLLRNFRNRSGLRLKKPHGRLMIDQFWGSFKTKFRVVSDLLKIRICLKRVHAAARCRSEIPRRPQI